MDSDLKKKKRWFYKKIKIFSPKKSFSLKKNLKSGKSQKFDLLLFSSVFSSNFHKNQKTDQKKQTTFKNKKKRPILQEKEKEKNNFPRDWRPSKLSRCRERTKRGISVFEVHQLMTLNQFSKCDFLGVVSGSAEASCSKTGPELLKLFTQRRSSGRIHGQYYAMLCEDAITSNRRSQQPTNSDHTEWTRYQAYNLSW